MNRAQLINRLTTLAVAATRRAKNLDASGTIPAWQRMAEQLTKLVSELAVGSVLEEVDAAPVADVTPPSPMTSAAETARPSAPQTCQGLHYLGRECKFNNAHHTGGCVPKGPAL